MSCVDDDTIERFRRLVAGSFRAPLSWAAVALVPTKTGDQLHVRVGDASAAGGPFYDQNTVFEGAFSFDAPAGEEPALRVFFDEGARRGGRPGSRHRCRRRVDS